VDGPATVYTRRSANQRRAADSGNGGGGARGGTPAAGGVSAAARGAGAFCRRTVDTGNLSQLLPGGVVTDGRDGAERRAFENGKVLQGGGFDIGIAKGDISQHHFPEYQLDHPVRLRPKGAERVVDHERVDEYPDDGFGVLF